jgi:hypothetical protein
MRLTIFLEEYAKHTALNIGQVMQGVRYFYSHPDCDEVAPRGTFKHCFLSMSLRARRIANDLFFSAIPPHWHHTPEELRGMRPIPIKKWFFYGYSAWQFDESGEVRSDLDGREDRRWDPRCQKPQT